MATAFGRCVADVMFTHRLTCCAPVVQFCPSHAKLDPNGLLHETRGDSLLPTFSLCRCLFEQTLFNMGLTGNFPGLGNLLGTRSFFLPLSLSPWLLTTLVLAKHGNFWVQIVWACLLLLFPFAMQWGMVLSFVVYISKSRTNRDCLQMVVVRTHNVRFLRFLCSRSNILWNR